MTINNEHEKLWKLFSDFDEYRLMERPEEATIEGDHRFDDRLSDVSGESVKKFYETIRNFISKLKAVNYANLDPEDRLNYDIFRHILEVNILEGEKFNFHYTPLWQQAGIHISLVYLAEATLCSNDEEIGKFISRLGGFQKQVNDTIDNIRRGIKEGYVMPGFVIAQILPQLKKIVSTKPEDTVFFSVCKNQDGVSANAKRNLIDTISGPLNRAFILMHDFIKREYLPACRKDEGIWSMPDGEQRYRYHIKNFTSIELEPDDVHRTGLLEVRRIEAEMKALIGELGFDGPIGEFNRNLRADKKFYFTRKEDLLNGYRKILNRMDSRLPEIFRQMPKAGYDLREIEESVAESAPAAYYFPASLDNIRKGYFYVNTSKLDSRPAYEMTALALHEAVPGHHFQIATAQELSWLPRFRRDWTGASAYVEGWALYSESLGHQTGMYDDPYQHYGALSLEIWRACRLVVDTGIHHKRWTRDKAVEFMRQYTPNSEHDISAEVDRYIAWPGQALSYKTGELKIKELRKYAENAFGSRFNLKDFHDVILRGGVMPLAHLEKTVKEWVNSNK